MPNFRGGRFAAVLCNVFVTGFALFAVAMTPALAEGLFAPLSANEARLVAAQAAPHDPLVKRSRVIKLDAGALAREIAPLGVDTAADRIERASKLNGVVTIELFTDAVATFRRSSVDTIGESGFSWIGNVDGNPLEFASLIVEDGEITGHVQLAARLFEIVPLANGLHRVKEIDPKKFPPDHPAGYKYPQPTPAPRTEQSAVESEAVVVPTTINVLVAYTAGAASQATASQGGAKAIITQAKQAVALANKAYTNGKVPIKLVMVGLTSTGTYIEFNNLPNNLQALDGRLGPGELLAIRNKREALKADLVVMLTSTSAAAGSCGIGNGTDVPSASTNYVAYSAVNWACIPNYSFHHELGHNMGLRHDHDTDPAVGVGYNFGYRNTTAGCKIYDIMAYYCPGCTRVNFFSSSTVKVKKGTKLCAIGKKSPPKAADGTRRLKETAKTIGAYR